MIKEWIHAFRLRTLPLSLATVLVGAMTAKAEGYANTTLLILVLLTTLFLQILSNLANDLGDFLKGTDNEKRIGPARSMQKGKISVEAMNRAIVIFSLLSLFFGLILLYQALGLNQLFTSLVFLMLGISAIWAAIRYTLGKNAYGYAGLGDVFVFLFFGLTAVLGTHFLLAKSMVAIAVLPAISMGLFSVAVLNLNNMRDVVNDGLNHKNTLIVKHGFTWGKKYHAVLLIVAWMLLGVYMVFYRNISYTLGLLALPFFIRHGWVVKNTTEPERLDAELKKLALSIALFSVLFAIASYV